MLDGAVVGTVTSGDWGHRVGKNLAYAFLRPDLAEVGTQLKLDRCGVMLNAAVIEPGVYDPAMERVRG